MAIVATAYVRLEVLSDNLGRDIRTAVQKAFAGSNRDLDIDSRQVGRNISQKIADGINDNESNAVVDDAAAKMGKRIVTKTSGPMDKDFGKNIQTAVRKGMRSADGTVDTETSRTGKRVESQFKKSFDNIKGLAKVLGKYISGTLIYSKPIRLTGIGAGVAAMLTELIPAVGGLGAALASGAAIGAAAFGSLALSAGALLLGITADVEGMKELKQGFTDLKTEAAKPIGTAMLPGMQAALENLRTVVRAVVPQLSLMGQVWGAVMARISQELAKPENISRLQSIMTDSAAATLDFGEAGAQLTTALLILGKAAQPLVQYFSQGALNMATWLRTTLEAKEANGELATSVDNLLARWKQFWETVKDFSSGLLNVFKAAMPVSDKMGASFQTMAENFKKWTGDEKNQARMTAFFEKMHDLAGPIVGLFGDIAKQIGLALEGMDTSRIKRVVTKIRTDVVPEIFKLIKEINDATGPGFEKTFDNLVEGFKKIVDSGTIPKVAGWVADLAGNVSGLVKTDLGSWLLGVGIALAPFGGMAGAIGNIGALGIGLKAWSLLRLGGFITQLSGLTTEVGKLSRINMAGTLAGLSGNVAAGVEGAVAGGVTAGSTAGASKGVTLLGGMKGILKGGIVAWIAGEILGAMNEDFKTQWDELWGHVFSGFGTAAQHAASAAGEGLQVFNFIIDSITGDKEGQERGRQALTTQLQDTFGGVFDEVANGWRDSWLNFPTLLAPTVQLAEQQISGMFGTIAQGIPRTAPIELLAVKQSLAEMLADIGTAIQNGATDTLPKITAYRDVLNKLAEANPSGPVHDMAVQLLAELANVEANVLTSGVGLRGALDKFKAMLSSGFIEPTQNDPFAQLKTNIRTSMEGLIAEIESNGPNVAAKAQEFVKLFAQLPADTPELKGWKDSILQIFRDAGIAIPDALGTVTENTRGAAGNFADVIGSALEQARQQTATKLGQLFATFQLTEMPTLTPLAQSVRDGLNEVAQAFATNAPDLQSKVDALLAVLNTVPSTSPLAGLRTQILEALKGMGVDVSAYAPILGEAGTTLGKAWGNSVPGGFSQGLLSGKPGALGQLDLFGADVVGKLGVTLPGLILGTAPAITGAVGGALSGVPGTGIIPFLNLNAQAGGIAGQLGSAILPGLLGATGTVGSGLSGVPATGSSPFNILGQMLMGIVGGFAGLILPGLSNAGRQPGQAWVDVPISGQAPWTTMAQAVIATLMMLAGQVASIMRAIAYSVSSAWAAIGAMNAGGLGGLISTAASAINAARMTEQAANTVQQNAQRIAAYIPAITAAVRLSNEALYSVQVQAQQAAVAAAQAASAAVAAAQARASAATAVPSGGGLLALATGGIVTSPTIALIGEAGRERVEPLDSQGLSSRDRAMITHIVASTVKAVQGQNGTTVEVILNPNGLEGVMNAVVTQRERDLARRVLYGRPVR